MSTTTQPPKPKRRWYRLLVVIVALGLAGCSDQEEPLDEKTDTNKQEPVVEEALTEEQAIAPHAINATHPPEVMRLMKLLPEIPVDASLDDILAVLGLERDGSSGTTSSTHTTFVWDIAPGYRFTLGFDRAIKSYALTGVFTSAGFAAQNKPGFASHEYHGIYPYRTRKGMVTARNERH